jgi:hypothetical protein
MRNSSNQENVRIAVQAHWLQYRGLTAEANWTGYRVENEAWKNSTPPPLEDVPVIDGLLVAT